MYEIIYLPVSRRDLLSILDYIAEHEKEPAYALSLLDKIDEAIKRLKDFPYSCRKYIPVHPLEYSYRVLPVSSYAVYYTVLEDTKTVEIHRIISQKMDNTNIID